LRLLLAALSIYASPLLVTLTFAGDASDSQYASDALTDFQKRLRLEYPDSASLFVPELSPKGRIHFHGLLFGLPPSLGDIKKSRRTIFIGTERTDRGIAKLWREGFVDLQQTDGSVGLAYYLVKYLNKEAGHLLFVGMRVPRVSHGFPKPLEYRGEHAEYITSKLSDLKPERQWQSPDDSKLNEFFGRITKSYYVLNEKSINRCFNSAISVLFTYLTNLESGKDERSSSR
jgi:hypothetical protein